MLNGGGVGCQILVGLDKKENQKHSDKSEVQGQIF